VVRLRVLLRFLVAVRAGFLAAPAAALARDAGALRAALARADVVDDLARVELVLRFAVERFAVARLAAGLRAPLLREDDDADLAALAPEPSSADHLPDITRWAASATASAIREPSLVALAIMLVAACEAVSAASRPASRIARRALGLALIAAAAAASPAASISLLIAALAILSTVSEDFLLEDLAMDSCPSVVGKRHFKPVTVPG
jgi:hypothetical protein